MKSTLNLLNEITPNGIRHTIFSNKQFRSIFYSPKQVLALEKTDKEIIQQFAFNTPEFFINFQNSGSNQIEKVEFYKISSCNYFLQEYSLDFICEVNKEDFVTFPKYPQDSITFENYACEQDIEKVKTAFLYYLQSIFRCIF